MISKNCKNNSSKPVIPQFYPTQRCTVSPILKREPVLTQFNMFQPRFCALAQPFELTILHPYWYEIDITAELDTLTTDSALEITVPFLGLTDLLNQAQFFDKMASFSPVIGFNGFCAKSATDPHDNYPRPDFVLITDCVGNQYEIVIDADGKPELPQEGTGLFSIASSITFIYNTNQIKNGFGLEKAAIFKQNKLYLLPPFESNETFEFIICTSHLNERNVRMVDSIRSVEVDYLPLMLENQHFPTHIERHNGAPELFHVNIALLLLSPFIAKQAFCATLKVDHEGTLTNANGWEQHPIHEGTFTKLFGVSENTLTTITHALYTDYDMVKDYLNGDTFGFAQTNGFNNFLLRPEAFGHFHALLVHDLVAHKIEGDFLFDRISEQHLAQIDFNALPVDLHDSIVLSNLQEQIHNHHYDSFFQLYHNAGNSAQTFDHFDFIAKGIGETMPQAVLEIMHDSVSPVMEHNGNGDQGLLHLHDIIDNSVDSILGMDAANPPPSHSYVPWVQAGDAGHIDFDHIHISHF